MKRLPAASILVATFFVAGASGAQQGVSFQEPELATTHHQMRINGVVLSYTARVGLIPIRNNEAEEVHGSFGLTSYTLVAKPGAPPRPVIFVWNGGPGSNSTTVQFTGFGPRRMRSADDAAHPTPVTIELYDNDATWLEFADLVFVDPVRSGFGRPARSSFGTTGLAQGATSRSSALRPTTRSEKAYTRR